MIRKKIKLGVLIISCLAFMLSSAVYATSYDYEITAQKMGFSWKVDRADFHVKLTAPTTGWVGIGFNPSKEMKDAKFVIGYIKDGKAIISDEFGTGEIKHEAVEKLGGKSDITLIGGKEEGGETTIEFTLPLVSKDTKGGKIDPIGKTAVLLAYGIDHDTSKLKHKFRTSITINLSTGKILTEQNDGKLP
jgi:hypothetical protein